MPTQALPGDIDHIVALALMENPQVRVAEHQVRVAESDFEISGAPFWPTLRAESEVAGEHNLDGIKGDEAAVTVQLVGEYNLYSGGRDTARRQAQRKRMAEAKYRLGIARRTAEREVRSAWAEMNSARDQIVELAESVNINNKLRKDYFVQFDLGDRSLLDVLDAEVAYFRARSNKILAEANENISLARVLASTARLVSSLDVGHPPAHDSHDSHMHDLHAPTMHHHADASQITEQDTLVAEIVGPEGPEGELLIQQTTTIQAQPSQGKTANVISVNEVFSDDSSFNEAEDRAMYPAFTGDSNIQITE